MLRLRSSRSRLRERSLVDAPCPGCCDDLIDSGLGVLGSLLAQLFLRAGFNGSYQCSPAQLPSLGN